MCVCLYEKVYIRYWVTNAVILLSHESRNWRLRYWVTEARRLYTYICIYVNTFICVIESRMPSAYWVTKVEFGGRVPESRRWGEYIHIYVFTHVSVFICVIESRTLSSHWVTKVKFGGCVTQSRRRGEYIHIYIYIYSCRYIYMRYRVTNAVILLSHESRNWRLRYRVTEVRRVYIYICIYLRKIDLYALSSHKCRHLTDSRN